MIFARSLLACGGCGIICSGRVACRSWLSFGAVDIEQAFDLYVGACSCLTTGRIRVASWGFQVDDTLTWQVDTLLVRRKPVTLEARLFSFIDTVESCSTVINVKV